MGPGSELLGVADVAEGDLGVGVTSFKAMLVSTVCRMKSSEMASVLPAVPTYFLTMFCTEQVLSSLPFSRLGKAPIEVREIVA
jgi:hypothetical protein